MDVSQLTAVGLTTQQAQIYAVLLEHGELKPSQIAKHSGFSRTNAYKILDRLAEMRLVHKEEKGKTYSYSLANPVSLSSLTAQYRAEATAREEAASNILQTLLKKYYKHVEAPHTETAIGKRAVADLYRKQIALDEDLYFIRTPADIPGMGFDTMHDLRVLPERRGKKRYGIMSAPDKGPINPRQHARSNLEVTWLESGRYTEPVEWSATDSSLLIITFGSEPQAILIVDPLVAAAFLQLWHILNTFIRNSPAHKKLGATVK